jgi:Ca-activated chloride channel family protein
LKRNNQAVTLKNSIQGFKESTSLLARLKPFLSVLRLLALSSLIVAMARPRTVDISNQNDKGNRYRYYGRCFWSMLKRFEPNRMEALKG